MRLTGDVRAQGSAETDRAALVAVHRTTGGDGWTNNDNWLSDAPLGDRYGVETNEQGRVTGLRLGGWDESVRKFVGNGLAGALPSELGTLSHLRWLEIGGQQRVDGAHTGGAGQPGRARIAASPRKLVDGFDPVGAGTSG